MSCLLGFCRGISLTKRVKHGLLILINCLSILYRLDEIQLYKAVTIYQQNNRNNREKDVEIAIKVVVVGNGAVGKSSMIQRYCKGIFTNDYKKTIGVDFLERQIQVNCEDVRLMLWDTAGQEEFDAITKAYYRGAQACVLVFSTVDRDSFRAIESWKRKVENECGEIPMVLVQNKIDLIEDAVVDREEAEGLARKLHLRFYRTSVKEDLNVKEVFHHVSERYLESLNEVPSELTLPNSSDKPQQAPPSRSGGGSGKLGRSSGNSSSRSARHSTNNGTISLQPIKKQGKKHMLKGCSML